MGGCQHQPLNIIYRFYRWIANKTVQRKWFSSLELIESNVDVIVKWSVCKPTNKHTSKAGWHASKQTNQQARLPKYAPIIIIAWNGFVGAVGCATHLVVIYLSRVSHTLHIFTVSLSFAQYLSQYFSTSMQIYIQIKIVYTVWYFTRGMCHAVCHAASWQNTAKAKTQAGKYDSHHSFKWK